MTPLQKDPKQLRTIKNIMVYKSDLKEKPGAAGEIFFILFALTNQHRPTSLSNQIRSRRSTDQP